MRVTYAIRRAARTHPDKPATVHKGRSRTWSEVLDRVARSASAFKELGLAEGDRLAVLAMNSDTFVELLYSVAWAGGVVVPLNIRWALPELEYAINNCGATILLLDDDFIHLAEDLKRRCPTILSVVCIGERQAPTGVPNLDELIGSHQPAEEFEESGEELYAIFYTGGTTGHPKGVMLSHRSVLATASSWLSGLLYASDNVHMHVAGLFHLAGAGQVWFVTLAAGTHVLLPKFDAEEVLLAVSTYNVTSTTLVPTMVNMLLASPNFTKEKLSSVRLCVYGGSPMPEALLETAIQLLPSWQFVQAYGMTETSGMSTLLLQKYHKLDPAHAGKLRAAGQPSHACEVRIVDAARRAVPVGTVGEIAIRGSNIMLGYWNNPEATRAVLVDGWMHTGDAAWIDREGFIYIVDRLKDMIVSGGENVYSAEVENAIYKHDAVLECAVIGIPSEKWGEQVHAIVVPKAGKRLLPDEIVAHCRTLIAGYKSPRSVDIQSEALPKSAAGKITKVALRERYWSTMSRRVN